MVTLAEAKEIAAERAVDIFVKSDTIVGLGTGSTAQCAIRRIAQLVSEKKIRNIRFISTSAESEDLALSLGLTVETLSEISPKPGEKPIDVVIDGADEITPDLQVLKGRGGALLREKFYETRAKRFIIIADHTKLHGSLGTGATPVEIVPFEVEATTSAIENLPSLRGKIVKTQLRDKDGAAFKTDNGNFVLDIWFADGKVPSPAATVHAELINVIGVVETGFFLDMNPTVIVGGEDGTARLYDGEFKDLKALSEP